MTSNTRKVTIATVSVGLVAVAALVQLSGTAATPTDDLRPLAHWVFQADTVAESEVAEKTGTLNARMTGEPKLEADPPALAFVTPADAVVVRGRVTPDAEFLPREAFTVAAWVRVDDPAEWGGILGCLQDNGPREKGFLVGFNKTHFFFGLSTQGADDGDGTMTYLTGNTGYEPGRWYHVAATYDGKAMRLYVNGRADGESAEQSGPVLYADAAPLVIGRYRDDDEDYGTRMAVREVIWSGRAAGAEQIAGHFRPGDKLAARAPAAPALRWVVEPYLQYATADAITVMAETDVATNCTIEYGPTFPPNETAKASAAGTMHEVRLAGLKPRTKYFYRVVCTTEDGSRLDGKYRTFTTAVGPTDAYSFAVIGDTQRNPEVTGKVAKLMWERRPHFVLHMGDTVNDGEVKKQWTDDLFRPCQELFGRVPVYPCLGNHERNHEHYYLYFSLPKPEYYYSFEYGNAEFFVLDTNKPIAAGSEQYAWLDKALAASDATWKVCYHHHPCYTSDSDDYGNTWTGTSKLGDDRAKTLIPLYEKHDVDLVMNGHIHLYERTHPIKDGRVDQTGVVYLTSGGGGGRLEDFDPTPAFFKNQGRVDYHFCYFTAHDRLLECKVFDHEGRLFDSFTMMKR